MENPTDAVDRIYERIEAYIKTTYQLYKLKAIQTGTTVATSIITKICVILVLFLFLITLSMGAAFYLGDVLGHAYYGFFIVAAFYLVTGIILSFFMHKWIRKSISNLIIKLTLK